MVATPTGHPAHMSTLHADTTYHALLPPIENVNNTVVPPPRGKNMCTAPSSTKTKYTVPCRPEQNNSSTVPSRPRKINGIVPSRCGKKYAYRPVRPYKEVPFRPVQNKTKKRPVPSRKIKCAVPSRRGERYVPLHPARCLFLYSLFPSCKNARIVV